MAQGISNNKDKIAFSKNLLSLDSAYMIAKENARTPDADLDAKKAKIEKEISFINSQIDTVKK